MQTLINILRKFFGQKDLALAPVKVEE